MEYEYSIEIDRGVEDVFAYMQDIEREAEWQPNLREAVQRPPGEPAVGTERRYVSEFLGKTFRNVYVFTGYEPNRRVAYESTPESDTRASGMITWESLNGGTRVTMRVSVQPGGLLRFVPRSLIASVGERELAHALARVKANLENPT
ncbi:MAG: hypothetical protein GWN99_16315 [Gemmatimonadetes bacterium]|uniref:Polyketide cyclase/dehydrase/lipid transport protein n=1 Tax=Candidatus Kutchimonas denitrificans TaxID=3056748 RepID=A0AAE4Z7D1_9BACT|nr:hypothetical protein [Gemmatimonadota bacterium]NIR74353.1 hypothetical protein [Candidatus Kutchimonas denitrificans]NIS02604.1 hypothetical protein [Gemmatimonadota bacterium]NIT68479.1 hypothetical protein [Gemmatimonadota bacterium]NIU51956.1 hypothetical protein [Gemmatimonadota bacterium]